MDAAQVSSTASKWRTFKMLLDRGDWRGISDRVLDNGLRIFGAFDPGNPKYFKRWQDTHPPRNRAQLDAAIAPLSATVSILTPVYDTPPDVLAECIASVKAQIYPHWQLVLVNDASKAPHIRPALDAWATDPRILVIHREQNGGIAAATDDGLRAASGEWIALLDHDDDLTEDALAEMMIALARTPQAVWAYSDFVMRRDGQLVDPFFKPDFSPSRLLSQMYLNHLQVMKRSAVIEAGGFRAGFDGSQDFDLALRMADTHRPLHVPRPLYRWRAVAGSTAENYEAKPYAHEAARRAIRTALVRRGLAVAQDGADGRNACDVRVEDTGAPGVFRVDYHLGRLPHGEEPVVGIAPRISIIIPFRDGWGMTERCLTSIVGRSSYKNYEIVLVDNGSQEAETREGVEHFCHSHRNARCLRHDAPFNHSELNNLGARHATGEVLLLLNNDIEVETEDWLERMLVHVQRPDVGAVGCLLLFPNRSIQHAGVVLGIRGAAGHAYKGKHEGHAGYFGSVAGEQEYSAVTAACLMVRKAVYEEVSGLDGETFPTSYNDVDFCLRLRQRGYRNVYTGHAKLVHYESYSRKRTARDAAFKRALQLRWGPLLQHDPYFSPNLSLEWEDYRFGV